METLVAFLPLIAIVLAMYFVMIRPAQKRQRKIQDMQSGLKKGDKIVTVGGLHGVVESFDQQHMYILVDEGSRTILKFERMALKEVVQ